ncbi:MAG: histidine phosphatase family protein [Oscillospiraceae bacterium]|nr:histidine phosphatase family protein [Oscillospiraceae bacterium]
MKIILIRHGMTEGNYKKKYIGVTDEDLRDTKCLEREYPRCMRVVSSPLKRCIQTAEYIYPSISPIICVKLSECDFGDFENKSYEELKDNADYQRWIDSGGRLPFPNGEAHDDFTKRCVEGFFEMIDGQTADTAFVIHGGSIMAIMQKLFGGNFYDYQVKNGCGFKFEMNAGGTVNDYSSIGGA